MDNAGPVLVTGATGSIGSVLVRRLSETGRRPIRALVRNPERAARVAGVRKVEIVAGDLARPDSLRGSADGCSLVYHCAAEVTSSNWNRSRTANVDGTAAMLEEAVRAGAGRFVYTSTIGVYGLPSDEVITEETPWTPYHTPYFETKQEAERVVQQAMNRLPVVIARLGDVFGPGQYVWTINLVEQMQRGVLMPPVGGGWLNPVYIENLVDALLLLGEHRGAAGEIFNVVDGAPISTADLFRRYLKMAGKRPTPMPAFLLKAAAWLLMRLDLLRGRDPWVSPGVVDYLLRKGKIYPEKLRGRLGWMPAVGQAEAFDRTETWLRQEGYLAWAKRAS